MQGTILILDGVSTNRIMLKVQLSSAYYRVVQADMLGGISQTIARTRPDLVITAARLPDGRAGDLCALLREDEATADIPVIVMTAPNDKAARLQALTDGADDVMAYPSDDMFLQARIRQLIRVRNATDELRPRDGASRAIGLSEPAATFVGAKRIVLIAQDKVAGARWYKQLKPLIRHDLRVFSADELQQQIAAGFVPDAIVIGLSRRTGDPDLRLVADLRAYGATRHAAILTVAEGADPSIAAEALDIGADDTMCTGMCPEELALRLTAQLRRKQRSDQMRSTLLNGLKASVRDPLTGLYNRRYALPHLARVARSAAVTGASYAVMLVDIDHFKRINDEYGHQIGDAVLTETARRLRGQLRPGDMMARIGGEEFLVVMEDITDSSATGMAENLCCRINSSPMQPTGTNGAIPVTVSIGVVVSGGGETSIPQATDGAVSNLIGQADRALYEAKDGGRNQVTLVKPAA